jgi:hypothetical protein
LSQALGHEQIQDPEVSEARSPVTNS